MDEAPIIENDPELADQAAEAAEAATDASEVEPAEEPAAEPEPEEPASEPEPEEPASEAESAEEPAAEPDQLSLDEMVESLKDPDSAVDESGVVDADAADADAAPGPVEEPVAAPALETEQTPDESTFGPQGLVRERLAARLPFGIYFGVWAVFAGVMTYLLWSVATESFTGSPLYAYFVLGGVALTVIGPLLGLAVWLLMRGRADGGTGAGLARAVFMRAAAATLAGDLVWWLGLVLLDLHRTGVLG